MASWSMPNHRPSIIKMNMKYTVSLNGENLWQPFSNMVRSSCLMYTNLKHKGGKKKTSISKSWDSDSDSECINDLPLARKLWHCWCNVQMWKKPSRERNQKKKKKVNVKQLSRWSPDPSLQWNHHNRNIIMIFTSIPLRNIQQFMKIHSYNHQEAFIRIRKLIRSNIN